MGRLKPGEIWEIKHVVAPKFHLSGPPRDIVGIYDNRYIDNPYQLKHIKELEERDRRKFIGDKNFEYKDESQFPPKPDMPNNQRASWYERKAQEAHLRHENGDAYWYYEEAANKTKNSYTSKRRLREAARSHLKVWRVKHGYC